VKTDVARRELAQAAGRVAPGGVRVERRSGGVAHAESHQRAAVGEVDAQPVPADGAVAKEGGRPLVIEPGRPLTACRRPSCATGFPDLQLRPADVVAGQFRPVALARVALVTLQQQGCDGVSVKSKENCGLCICSRSTSPPACSCRCIRQAPIETSRSRLEKLAPRLARAARSACAAARREGQRGMREEDLARGNRRAQRFGGSRPAAEEGELKADVGFGESSAPVTYHHSVRKSGCAPWSRGNASGTPGVTGA
jgi:hypothetical protein